MPPHLALKQNLNLKQTKFKTSKQTKKTEAGGVAYQAKGLITKPDKPSLTLGTHVREGPTPENCPLSSTSIITSAYTHARTHALNKKTEKSFKLIYMTSSANFFLVLGVEPRALAHAG